jgi:hypothetical protein
MANDTLLVIGLPRAELAFGDRVAEAVARAPVDVLRIPHGITQPRRSPRERFQSRTEHREIYLQLRQEVRGRYVRMIDLHHGLDAAGPAADVYCHDEAFLARLAARLRGRPGATDLIRLVRIVAPDDRDAGATETAAEAVAATWIPAKVWRGDTPLYVGLEVYLTGEGREDHAGRAFARDLIADIYAC